MKGVTLKQRISKLDSINSKVQKIFQSMDIKDKTLNRLLDNSNKEQNQNANNSNFTGFIVSKEQLKNKPIPKQAPVIYQVSMDKQQQINALLEIKQKLTDQKQKLLSQDINLNPDFNEEKQYLQNTIQSLDNKINEIRTNAKTNGNPKEAEVQKDKQQQINTLLEMKKKLTERKHKLFVEDVKLKPQIIKLKEEKQSLQEEISNLDNKIEEIKAITKTKCDQVQRNWREDRKNFEQSWNNLEASQSKIIMQTFEEKLQTLEMCNVLCQEIPSVEEEEEPMNKSILEQLSEEIDQLLASQQEHFKLEPEPAQAPSNRRYQSPLQIIEEEQSMIDNSFQQQ